MTKRRIDFTVSENLCISCGVCKGACAVGCIELCENSGMFVPKIDENRCTNCSVCADLCPGLGFTFDDKGSAEKTVAGQYISLFNAWSRDGNIRHVSASGGVITTVVKDLLQKGAYDAVFCLDNYNYDSQLKAVCFDSNGFLESISQEKSPKSRYLPVSHENTVSFIRKNRDKRTIIVGTSCALRGILKVIERYSLNRENYLLIGLFCDKVFNYNIVKYFEDTYCGGEHLNALHFKNKESGGWPGDMKFFKDSGESFYVPLEERGKMKEYFMPERCLYCVDKLNAAADISLGDNYTPRASSPLGSNSVIIRTERGVKAWEAASDCVETAEVELSDILKAQYLNGRLENLNFAYFKEQKSQSNLELNRGVKQPEDAEPFRSRYKRDIEKLSSGGAYKEDPQKLKKQIRKTERLRDPRSLPNLWARGRGYLKRKIKKLLNR